MKTSKLASILLAAAMLVSLCSCGRALPEPYPVEPQISSAVEDVADYKTPVEADYEMPLKYDPKIMDKKGEAYLGELLPLYHACIDAIVAYEPSVSGFASFEDFEKVWQVLWIAFYPAPALLIQSFSDSETPYVFEGDTVTFQFRNSDKESHDAAYNAFADVINEGLSLICPDDDD